MPKWKRVIERSYDKHRIADEIARTFDVFIGHERTLIRRALARNVEGYVGQQYPVPVHQFSQRGQQFETAYSGQDWQTRATASFARLYSRVSESFRPIIDLGVYDADSGELSKSRYHLGRRGILRVVEYMPPADGGQSLANMLYREPFNRETDERSYPIDDPIHDGGYVVGPEELEALIKVLHTNPEQQSYNKVYEIPGLVRKSE